MSKNIRELVEPDKQQADSNPLEHVVMLHWFCFSYIGRDYVSNQQVNACTYTGYEDNNITMAMINANKKNAGVKSDACLISVSYLAHMTKEEFKAT
jgi:hypothetical protein